MSNAFDVVVIGSGPGGYIAALKAAERGASVAMVEKQTYFGGTCLNVGCIPSKALLAPAELAHGISHAGEFGVTVDGPAGIDWPVVQKRKDKVIAKLRGGIKGLFKARGIEVFTGFGRLAGPGKITVTNDDGVMELGAKSVIIAVGSVPMRIPGWPDDPSVVCTSDEALHWDTLPKKLIIVGGGVIGCEFACMMQPAGVEVTIVEMMPRLLPEMEADTADALAAEFKKRNITMYVGTKVAAMSEAGGVVTAELDNGESIQADRVLLSVGRRPATADLGLETVGVAANERGFIPVDEKMQTTAPGVYCIGDANGRCLLAHAASAQGVTAVINALGGEAVENTIIPWAVYTFPEAAGVGTTEARALEKGLPISVGMFPLGHLGKAMASGHGEGFVKVIAHRETDAILGVHIFGHNATEMIHSAVAMMTAGATTHQLAEMIFAHPTLSEGVKEAAEDALGMALHLPPRKMTQIQAELA